MSDNTLKCPDCGRQLHAVAEDGEYQGLYKCFNGPKYWRETDKGELEDVSDEKRSVNSGKERGPDE